MLIFKNERDTSLGRGRNERWDLRSGRVRSVALLVFGDLERLLADFGLDRGSRLERRNKEEKIAWRVLIRMHRIGLRATMALLARFSPGTMLYQHKALDGENRKGKPGRSGRRGNKCVKCSNILFYSRELLFEALHLLGRLNRRRVNLVFASLGLKD